MTANYIINFKVEDKYVLPEVMWAYLPRVDDIITSTSGKYTVIDIEHHYDPYRPTVTLHLQVNKE